MKRLVKMIAVVLVVLALFLIVVLLFFRVTPQGPSESWIAAKYAQLDENMSLGEIYGLIGREGDYRVDPQKSVRRQQPLLPFIRPSKVPVDLDMTLFQFGLGTLNWDWDYGTIAIQIDGSNPPHLWKKAIQLSDGPRHPLSRAADPLRIRIYSVVDNDRYNAIWLLGLVLLLCTVVVFRLFWRNRSSTRK